ncbi:hypothetical protein IQ241_08625 [Romeria aff. gracilis LEGE 07310]|uniref:Uncharacterized protein n=1 Tax=Vasconcelosia minhoensis LEGE 07310 TaxID=915328 RepID=A0A8J7DQY3_9CYAN|nr:hypothetical protein [Romeria gracilis]MBE9077359.1 hypothetical protein [Romeria aff. gracilis LEGE 07310]
MPQPSPSASKTVLNFPKRRSSPQPVEDFCKVQPQLLRILHSLSQLEQSRCGALRGRASGR